MTLSVFHRPELDLSQRRCYNNTRGGNELTAGKNYNKNNNKNSDSSKSPLVQLQTVGDFSFNILM